MFNTKTMSLKSTLWTFLRLGRSVVSRDLRKDPQVRDPIVLFEAWFQAAIESGIYLPEAITLASSTSDGIPSARMVLLKGVDSAGFVFYTNYTSRKAVELTANPRAALVAYWATLQRQVRIEGMVERVSPEESEAYFASRGRQSRIGAWASKQSARLENRETLLARVRRYNDEFEDSDVPLPPFWGGYRVVPERIEFWQGRANRLHDRLVFTRKGDAWDLHRLYP